jgi:hypothetical protein
MKQLQISRTLVLLSLVDANGSRLIFFPLVIQMFQFPIKFEKNKKRA